MKFGNLAYNGAGCAGRAGNDDEIALLDLADVKDAEVCGETGQT